MFVFIVGISIHTRRLVVSRRPDVKYCGERETSLARPIKNTHTHTHAVGGGGGYGDKTGNAGKKVARDRMKRERVWKTRNIQKKENARYFMPVRKDIRAIMGKKNERVFVTYSRRPRNSNNTHDAVS